MTVPLTAAFRQFDVNAFVAVTLAAPCRLGDWPSAFNAWISAPAVAGYPHLTVPGGFVGDLPVGISFIGRAWSEATLLRLGYAFEKATRHRRPPTFLAEPSYQGC